MSVNADDLVKEYFPALPATTQAPMASDSVTDCNSNRECSGNGLKNKCWMNRCVECHRHNQCVDPSKLTCNKQTYQCENGNFLGAYLTRKLNNEIIVRNMDILDNYLNDINTNSIPELFYNTR